MTQNIGSLTMSEKQTRWQSVYHYMIKYYGVCDNTIPRLKVQGLENFHGLANILLQNPSRIMKKSTIESTPRHQDSGILNLIILLNNLFFRNVSSMF